MLLERDRKLFFIFAIISIALSAIVCVPFSLTKVTLFEIIFKYIAVPITIGIFTFLTISAKYRSYRPAVKYTTIVANIPLFSYIAAMLFNTILIISRNSVVFNSLETNVWLMGMSLMLVVSLVLIRIFPKFVVMFSKNEAMLVDAIFAILAVIYVFTCCSIAFKYRKAGPLEDSSFLFILFPIIIGLLGGALHIVSIKNEKEANNEFENRSREELYELWKENCKHADEIYDAAREDITESLFGFTLGELGFVESEEEPQEFEQEQDLEPEVIDNQANEELQAENATLLAEIAELKAKNQQLQDKLNEATSIIGNSKDKIIETLQKCADNDTELVVDSLQHSLDVIVNERQVLKKSREKLAQDLEVQKAELQAKIDAYNAQKAKEEQERAEAEEKARLDAERRAQAALEREKEKKPIEPSFEKFIEFATALTADRDDVEIAVNDKQTQYKFTCCNKAYAILQKTNNDYRISFIAQNDEMRDLMYEFNGIVDFEKNIDYDKSGYQVKLVKLVYKGDESMSFEKVQELISHSLENLLEGEKIEQEAIEKEKAIKERAKLAEKALKEKERQQAKEEKQRLLAEQKAREEQENNQQDENSSDDEAA